MLLPSDLRLCRLVLYGVLFACPCDVIVIAAALQSKDPFSMPTKKIIKDDVQFVKSLSHTTASRAKFDDVNYSEPIMLRNLVKGWLGYANRWLNMANPLPLADIRRRFCQDNALNYSRFLSLETLVWDIAESVERMLDRDSPALSDVKSLLAAFPTKRRKGAGVYVPAQWDHPPKDPDIASLFVKDMKKLNFVFAAAFNPAILQGISLKKGLQLRAQKVQTYEKLIAGMEKASVDPKLAICVPKIPEIFHYDTEHLSDVVKRIAPPEKLEVVSTDRVFLEYKLIRFGIRQKSIVNDVPPGAHALSQFGEGRESFPVQLIKVSSSTVDEDGIARVQMKQPIQPHQINWSLMSIGGAPLMSGKGACKPRFEWKNPIGFACETEGVDHYAVGCKFTASSFDGSGWIDGVSVLPSDCDNLIGLLSILAFQPKQFGAKFQISFKKKRILAVELFGHECKFSAKHPLTRQLLQILNEVRKAISDTFAEDPTSHRGIPSLDLSPLMEKLFREARHPQAVPGCQKGQPTSGRRRGTPMVWPEALKMPQKFTVLPLVDQASGCEEVSKSKKDDTCEEMFTVSAFHPELEWPDFSHDQGDGFVLLEPYNDKVLEEDFIASRRKTRCKAVEDRGIKTTIEAFPDSDWSDDEVVHIVEILYPSLESTIGRELLKRAPGPVPLAKLGCALEVREMIESCEHHLGTPFDLKNFLADKSALFQCVARRNGLFQVSLTPAGEHKFASPYQVDFPRRDEPSLSDDSVLPESHSNRAPPGQVDFPRRGGPSMSGDSVLPESHSTAPPGQVDFPRRGEPSISGNRVPPGSHSTSSSDHVDISRRDEPSLSDVSVPFESHPTASPDRVDVPRRDEPSPSDEQNRSHAKQYNVPRSSGTQCKSNRLENNLVELLSEYLAHSSHEQQPLARVGSHPPIKAVVQQLRQRKTTPFKWKSFLLKHRDRFLVTGVLEQQVKLRSPEESQVRPGDEVENTLCTLSEAEGNFLELLPDLGKEAFPVSEAIQTLRDVSPAMNGTTAGPALSHCGRPASQARGAGVRERRRDPEVKEKPGTDAVNVEQLEVRLLEAVCCAVKKRQVLARVASDPKIQKITKAIKNTTGSKFRWMPFLEKHSAKVKTTMLSGDHWLSLTEAAERPVPQAERHPAKESSAEGDGIGRPKFLPHRLAHLLNSGSSQELEGALKELICEFLECSPGYQLLSTVGSQPNILAVTTRLRVKSKRRTFKWEEFLSRHSDIFQMRGFDVNGIRSVKLK